jgi:hypothetical protein
MANEEEITYNQQDFTLFHQNNLNDEFRRYCKKNAPILLQNHPDNFTGFKKLLESIKLNKPFINLEACNDSLQKLVVQISKIENYSIQSRLNLQSQKYESVITKIAFNAKNILIYARQICENNFYCVQTLYTLHQTFHTSTQAFKSQNLTTRPKSKDSYETHIKAQALGLKTLTAQLDSIKDSSMVIWPSANTWFDDQTFLEDFEIIKADSEGKQTSILKHIQCLDSDLQNAYVNSDNKR